MCSWQTALQKPTQETTDSISSVPANDDCQHRCGKNPEQPEPPKFLEVEIASHQRYDERQYLESAPPDARHDHLRSDWGLRVRRSVWADNDVPSPRHPRVQECSSNREVGWPSGSPVDSGCHGSAAQLGFIDGEIVT